ncbi:Transcriptional regulator STERILE APETALA [Acorus gramineus]|uniref:Transcriptional regulator STERILE APETALA n=1 Tax=Acorus gramineus TaxID=55184 RepID=A0AAV9BD41_ACOGR|nr:Transcriptional regulator STERILE APETALA [Acorus gramineus]
MSASSSRGGGGGDREALPPPPSSSSRMRGAGDGGAGGVWPEHFVEAVAARIATDSAASSGRLSAATALVNLFEVCTTWRNVSRSELLWRDLTRRIWGRDVLRCATWHEEYILCHRTARNFYARRAVYTALQVVDAADGDADAAALSCRCLAISDTHLACGFLDGSVRVFGFHPTRHVSTFYPHEPRDRLGRFSRSVSGAALVGPNKLVFASMDGDVHVAVIDEPSTPARRAHVGNVVEDGPMLSFSGGDRYWVGLYAGVPGRAVHVWDGETEALTYIGGSLTDLDSVAGWQALNDPNESVGRVRVSARGLRHYACACTRRAVEVYDLEEPGVVVHGEEARRGGTWWVDAMDVWVERVLTVDGRGLARVRRVVGMVEVKRFVVRGVGMEQRVVGCMNGGYVVTCAGGAVRVWDAERGVVLYGFRERVGEVVCAAADDGHVAVCSAETGLHLWSF